MINLLSPEEKRQLRAARTNVLLLRYNILVAITILAVGGVFGVGFFITFQEREQALQEQRDNQARTADFSQVRREAEEFTKNLATAKSILSQEIVYSELLVAVAKTLPRGTVLTDISLTPANFNTPSTLAARTKNYDGALQLKGTLEASPLFSNVSITNIIQDSTNRAYPVSVQLNVTLHPEGTTQ
ncbi:MAG TPA: hypothetical protein VD907_00730 [Verrucomicrobiae bacterium]|nr:hypothetical protein [Verrucomicrobiae bacterium]